MSPGKQWFGSGSSRIEVGRFRLETKMEESLGSENKIWDYKVFLGQHKHTLIQGAQGMLLGWRTAKWPRVWTLGCLIPFHHATCPESQTIQGSPEVKPLSHAVSVLNILGDFYGQYDHEMAWVGLGDPDELLSLICSTHWSPNGKHLMGRSCLGRTIGVVGIWAY